MDVLCCFCMRKKQTLFCTNNKVTAAIAFSFSIDLPEKEIYSKLRLSSFAHVPARERGKLQGHDRP